MKINLPAFRLILTILFITLLGMMDGGHTRAQTPTDFYNAQKLQTEHTVQIEDLSKSFDRLEKHLEKDDQRIDDLQDDQHTWKGIIVGIGSIIALLELLQALGFTRKISNKEAGKIV